MARVPKDVPGEHLETNTGQRQYEFDDAQDAGCPAAFSPATVEANSLEGCPPKQSTPDEREGQKRARAQHVSHLDDKSDIQGARSNPLYDQHSGKGAK